MGQYYGEAVKQNNKVYIFDGQVIHDDWNGLKLMEHSWLYNKFMMAMTTLLEEDKANVVWCGDYADEDDDFESIDWIDYNAIHGDRVTYRKMNPLTERYDYKHKYLVNHTQKCYIDFDLYISKSTDSEGWCIHPLSLLTAVGNGRGGGDYSGINSDVVGTWAGNELEVTKEIPNGYSLEDIVFSEEIIVDNVMI